MDWNRPAVRACISEKLLRKKAIYLYFNTYTNIDKVKIFCVIHGKVALLTRKCSDEWETRNRNQRIFRKVLTILENVDQKMNFL